MEAHPMLSPLYELADGDKGFVAEILESMATGISEDIAEIEKAIEQKQVSLICRSAHHMKSSIMYSNAEALKTLLSEIENKEGETIDSVKVLIPKLKEQAKALADIIEIERKK